MKRASYRDAIDWIAQNDSPADEGADDPSTVQNLVSSVLVADIFGLEQEKVGRDVVKRRQVSSPSPTARQCLRLRSA